MRLTRRGCGGRYGPSPLQPLDHLVVGALQEAGLPA
jgi:hypothetical protein